MQRVEASERDKCSQTRELGKERERGDEVVEAEVLQQSVAVPGKRERRGPGWPWLALES